MVVGSGIGGGATTVSCLELFDDHQRDHQADDEQTATAATTHSQRGDFGSSGGRSRRFPGRVLPPYWPYWPVAYGS